MLFYSILLLADSPCSARDVSIIWNPNTEHDLAGYNVYYRVGSAAAHYDGFGVAEGLHSTDVHNVTSATLTGLDPALNYYLAVTAYNDTGVEGVLSDVVAFYDIVPPTVSIISPVNNQTVSGNIDFTVNASDAGGIAKVEFYIDSVFYGAKDAAPYSLSWNALDIPEKTYTLFAQAYDIAGNETQSSSVQVKVIHDNTLSDALQTLKFVIGLETPTAAQFAHADVAPIDMTTHQPNPDSKLDIDDVLVMLRRAVGLLTW